MNWTPAALDRLERAMAEGSRITMWMRGTEITMVPSGLRYDYGGELLVGQHLGTGDRVEVPLDEVDDFVVLD